MQNTPDGIPIGPGTLAGDLGGTAGQMVTDAI